MSAGLDPAGWGTREISALTVQARRGPKQAGRGTRHLVSTEHPLSTRAAVATLRSGGTAADALVAAAILQTVIMPGTVTLAGTMGGLYFDLGQAGVMRSTRVSTCLSQRPATTITGGT